MKGQANMRSTVWIYQWKQLVRNQVILLSFGVLMLAALYGTYYGRDFTGRQRAMVAESDSLDRDRYEKSNERFLQYLDKEGAPADDPRRQLTEYSPSKAYFQPTDFAALAIGQKDNLPFTHPRHSYQESIYSVGSTDIQNPGKLLAGNFDLSFIILYLLPLLVIVYGYGLRSEEEEQGTYTLVRAQSDAGRVLLQKLLFRCAAVCGFMAVLNLAAFSVAGIPVMAQWAQKGSWLLITVAYTVFWFSLVWLVASLRTSGSIAALLLGGLWVLLLLLVPALVYRRVAHPQQQEQARILFNQRGDFPKAYDLTPERLADSFARLVHPIALPAMADTGERMQRIYRAIHGSEIQRRFDDGLGRRVLDVQSAEYRSTVRLNWLNPAYAVQNAFSQVAGTEINHYHDYLAKLEKYDRQYRYVRYRRTLEEGTFAIRMDDSAVQYIDYSPPVVWPWGALALILPVLVLAAMFLFLAGMIRTVL